MSNKSISIHSNKLSDKEYKVIKNSNEYMETKPNIFSSLIEKQKKDCNIGLDLLVNQTKNKNKSSQSNSIINNDEDFILDAIEEQKINNTDKQEEDKFSFRSYASHPKNNIQTFEITKDSDTNKKPNLITQDELDKISELVISKDEKSVDIKKQERTYSNTNNFKDIKKEKEELLFKFEKLRRLGTNLQRTFNMSSDIYEMREEYNRLRKSREVENGIKFSRKMLVACTTGLEFLNSKFDPLDIKLDGWSESIHENIGEYDEVFEELYEKYKTDTPVAPELKLLMMIGGSGLMFHLTNTMFKSSLPGMGDMLKNNPDLMKKFAKVAMDSVNNTNNNSNDDIDNIPMPNYNSNKSNQREMKGPTDVEDLLKELGSEESNISENKSTHQSFPFNLS